MCCDPFHLMEVVEESAFESCYQYLSLLLSNFQ